MEQKILDNLIVILKDKYQRFQVVIQKSYGLQLSLVNVSELVALMREAFQWFLTA